MKFVYNILIFIFISGALSGCDDALNWGVSDDDRTVNYQILEFSRKGGQCLGDPKVTKENERCATVKVRYPEIETTPVADMRDQLNTKIQDILLSGSIDEAKPKDIEQMAYLFIQEFKKELEHSAASWNLEKDIQVMLNTPQIISFQINESGYTGGAHGYSNTSFMNIDLDIMQEVKLADLLLPGYEAELNVTGEKIFRDIRDIPADADLYEAGFEFENNQFALSDESNSFGVTDKGLLFYFNSYDIASYADGPTEVFIPYSKIQNLIDPNGLISSFIVANNSNN